MNMLSVREQLTYGTLLVGVVVLSMCSACDEYLTDNPLNRLIIYGLKLENCFDRVAVD